MTVDSDTGVMSQRSSTRVCSVVIRAWAEPGANRPDIRARVLLVDGANAHLQELGLAVGDEAIARLVIQGLVDAFGMTALGDY